MEEIKKKETKIEKKDDHDMKDKKHHKKDGDHKDGDHKEGDHKDVHENMHHKDVHENMHHKDVHENMHHDEDEKVEKFFNMSNTHSDNVPQGYNNDPNCLTNCCSGEKSNDLQCDAVTTFTNEMNAQGLNCPMGFDGNHVGSMI